MGDSSAAWMVLIKEILRAEMTAMSPVALLDSIVASPTETRKVLSRV